MNAPPRQVYIICICLYILQRIWSKNYGHCIMGEILLSGNVACCDEPLRVYSRNIFKL